MGDQGHDSIFNSTMLENIVNQISIAFDRAIPSKKMTPSTKNPSSIIEKESYKDKKCGQLATKHLKQELLRGIKHFILSPQQGNKTNYMDEYIKAMQDQIALFKSEFMFLRGELKGNNNNNDNNNNNNDDDDDDDNNNNNNNG